MRSHTASQQAKCRGAVPSLISPPGESLINARFLTIPGESLINARFSQSCRSGQCPDLSRVQSNLVQSSGSQAVKSSQVKSSQVKSLSSGYSSIVAVVAFYKISHLKNLQSLYVDFQSIFKIRTSIRSN